MSKRDILCADNLRLDKEDDGGPWLLTHGPVPHAEFLRLRITVGGPADWYTFRAEVQLAGRTPVAVGHFEIAPLELFLPNAARDNPPDAEPWCPSEEPDFLQVPVEYQAHFAAMVRSWGQLAGLLVPAAGEKTIH